MSDTGVTAHQKEAQGRPQVTGTTESETTDKGDYCRQWKLLSGGIERTGGQGRVWKSRALVGFSVTSACQSEQLWEDVI